MNLRWFGAARAAAGVPEEVLDAPDSLADLVQQAVVRHGPALAAVLPRCSFLVDGVAVGDRPPATVTLAGVQTVDVLPPVAGG